LLLRLIVGKRCDKIRQAEGIHEHDRLVADPKQGYPPGRGTLAQMQMPARPNGREPFNESLKGHRPARWYPRRLLDFRRSLQDRNERVFEGAIVS
jgi:hypothetical protein